jgi:hypothetical protein
MIFIFFFTFFAVESNKGGIFKVIVEEFEVFFEPEFILDFSDFVLFG